MSFTITRKTSATTKVEWIVPNLIVRNNVNLIDGRKSSGKSSVIAAVLGDWNREPQEVNWHKLKNILWLTSEEDYEIDVKPRLLQYGVSEEQITTIDYRNGNVRKPELPTDRDQFARFLGEHKINALVIDPFQELKPREWSINDADQMRAYMTSLVSICSMCECTAFVPRHMRKATGSFSGDDGMGSNQIKASIRHPLRIDVTEEKIKRRFLSVEESNIAKPSMPMQFGFEDTEHSFGKLVWMGYKDIAIDEIKKLAESKVKRSKLEDAKTLLSQALIDGDRPANLLIEEAKNYGIGDRTLDDAKADMGVTSHRVINPTDDKPYWVWRLPESMRSETYIITQGKEMPQLTLEDLKPTESQVMEEYAAMEKAHKEYVPDQVTKPKRERKPKVAGQGTTPAPKKPRVKKSK